MSKIKKALNGDIIVGDKNRVKEVLMGFIKAVLGFVLSSVQISESVAPFGLAYIPCGGAFGLLGVLVGVWLNGEDIFRYFLAAVVNLISFRFLKSILDLPKGVIAFTSVLWSVLVAGLGGLLAVRTSFTENCFFALTGVVAGFFAYVFTVYEITFSKGKGFNPTSRVEYSCCLATVAVVLVAFSSLGGVWSIGAAILSYLCVFTVSSASGFLNSFVFSSVVGFSLLLADGENTVILASLMFGALLSSIVAPMGKYAVFTSYAVAGIITGIYFRADGFPFTQLFNIIAAGVIFIMIPKSVYLTMTEILIPQTHNVRKKMRKKKLKSRTPVRSAVKNSDICKICSACKNKFICWVKDYGYTSEVFSDFRRNVKRGEPSFPSHFLGKCPNTEAVAKELSSGVLNTSGFKVEYSKCSEPKVGQTVCGDSCCVFTSENKQIICIADGMGSGINAAKESHKSAKLMEGLMRKGVSKEDAIRVINETLIKSDCETVLALDVAVIDLKTGVCEFVKAGAAPTYVIRNGSVYELGSRSVPVGILDELSLEYERSRLLSGDVILMVSDGMVSDGGEWLNVLIRGMSELEVQSPLLLSGSVMTTAKHLKKNYADDITVIAVRIR